MVKMNQTPEEVHIRHCMLYEFHKGSNATTATESICHVYPNALDVRKCQRWFSKFKSGNYELSNSNRSGRPTTVDNDILRAEVEANPCQTIEELSVTLNKPRSTVQEHLQQIGKVNKEGVWISNNLSEESKGLRSSICHSLIQRHKKKMFFDHLIIEGAKWILYDYPKRKREWKSSPHLLKTDLLPKKAFLCVWWSIQGVIHFEVLESEKILSSSLYCKQLEQVNQLLIQKSSEFGDKGIILQQGNVRPHSAKQSLEKLIELGWEVLPYPLFSADIAPSDFHLFRSLQNFLSGKHFKTLNDLQTTISKYFSEKPTNFYRFGIVNLINRWQKVVDNEGDYIID